MTLLPELTSKASVQRCNAAVPLATATAYFAPMYFAKAASNFSISGPCVRKSDFNTLITASISCSVIFCFPYGIGFIN